MNVTEAAAFSPVDVALATLEERARALIDAHEFVSFDVFDTLLLRRLPRPVDVFSIVRLRAMHAATRDDAPIVDGFPTARVAAERAARADLGEVTFDDIYAAFARESDAPARLVEELKAMELAVEREVVYANPIGMRLLAYARGRGKTIVFSSDMYLPSAEIARLLRACGYEIREPIYVSCEAGGTKHLGTLFPIVLARHATLARYALHVGDNAHGDVAMARAAGLSALHLPLEPAPIVSRLAPGDDERHRTVHAIVEGAIGKRTREAAMPADPFEHLGYRVFGPLFAGFAIWLAAKIRERRPDKVLFVARDTFFIREHLAKFRDVPIDDAYLYASRGSLLLPSFTDFPIGRLVHLVSGKQRLTVARHLRRLGLAPGRYTSAIRAAGFDGSDDLASNGDPRLIALLAKLHRDVLRIAARRRPLARRYLADTIGDAKRVFVVDVGWIGTIQASIARLLQCERPDLVLEGQYVAILARPEENASTKHAMSGWLSAGATEWERAAWWSGAIEILEFAMTAPHGTTLGYEENPAGDVVPIVDAAPESDDRDRVRNIQRGAAAFIDDVLASYGDLTRTLDSRAWAERFFDLATAPSRDDAALLGDIAHGDVAGDASVRSPLAASIDGAIPFEAFEHSFWKAGFVTRNALHDRDAFDETLYLEIYPDVRAAVEAGSIASGSDHFEAHGEREKRYGSWADVVRGYARED